MQYSDQPTQWPRGTTGRVSIRHEAHTPLESYEDTMRSEFTFILTFQLKDVRGRKGALASVLAGCAKVFAHDGAAVFDTHLDDTGGKRAGESGRLSFTPVVAAPDTLGDEDEPEVDVRVTIDVTHEV